LPIVAMYGRCEGGVMFAKIARVLSRAARQRGYSSSPPTSPLISGNILDSPLGALTIQQVAHRGFNIGGIFHTGGVILGHNRLLLWDPPQYGLGNSDALLPEEEDSADDSVFRRWDPEKVFAVFHLVHPKP
ncbi:hypothetical protein HDU82_003998, partial [Entophlyctis luteolus]